MPGFSNGVPGPTPSTTRPNKITENTTGSLMAYALRKVRGAYTGSAVQVRRSSDNATADIGFDTNGNLDTAALLNHCGSGDGFVSIWYDQTATGRNLTQSTAAAQPKIVNAGSLITYKNRPILQFDGTDDEFRTSAFTSAFPNGFTVVFAGASTSYATGATFVNKLAAANDRGAPFKFYVQSSGNNIGRNLIQVSNGSNNTSPADVYQWSAPQDGFNVWSFGANQSAGVPIDVKVWFNGKMVGARTGGNYGETNEAMIVGANTDGSLRLTGTIGEIYINNDYLSDANRINVENDLKDYFGVARTIPQFVFHGDSLTSDNSASTPGAGLNYPEQLRAMIDVNKNYYWRNAAVSGDYLGVTAFSADVRATTTVNANYTGSDLEPDLSGAILICWAGTNDMVLGGVSVSGTYTRLKNYIANRKASGKYSRIAFMTCIPRSNSGNPQTLTRLFPFNDLVRAGWGNGELQALGLTDLIDLQQMPIFSYSGAEYNPVYYYQVDNTHLTPEGYRQVAMYVKAQLRLS